MSTNPFTTTRLTDRLDAAMPRRHQLVLLAVVAWVAAGALAASLTRPHATPAPMPAILIIATPTAHAIQSRAAPPERGEPPATATAEPPTPEPVVIVQTVVVYEPMYVAQPAQEPAPDQVEQPEPTATYPAWYTDIPGAPPEIVAACQQEPARSSWVCGGTP